MATHELFSSQESLALLRKHWGWIALRGVLALLFGVMTLAVPGVTLGVLVIIWGAYALIDGALALIAGFRLREAGRPLWSLVIVGLLGIGAGVVTFLWPGLTAITLVLIIGIWAIAMGMFQIVAAVRFRQYIRGEWLHALSGVLSILFGFVMVLQPLAGALALVWVIGWFAILFGVMLIVVAFRLRRTFSFGN